MATPSKAGPGERWDRCNERVKKAAIEYRAAKEEFNEVYREMVERQLAVSLGEGRLTSRESEILPLLMDGKSNKEIGASLNIAEITVKFHVRHLLRKYGARDRFELMKARFLEPK